MAETKRLKAQSRPGFFAVLCCGLLLMFAAMLSVGPAWAQKSDQPKTLKIGYLLCLSGWYSAFDGMEEGHLKAVAQMINDRGGITVAGQKYNIELVGEDGKSTLDGITAGATRLAYDHKVKFVIGPDAFYSSASSPVFEQNNVLHVSGWVTLRPGEMDASTPYGFLGFNSTMGILQGTVQVIKKEFPNVKKLVLTNPDDGSQDYLLPKIKKVLAAHGYTVVDVVSFSNEMEDFSPVGVKANAIKGYDAIMNINSSPVALGKIVKAVRGLGNEKPIIANQAIPAADILAICGKEAADNVTTSGLIPLAKGNPPLMDEVFNRSGKKPPIFLFNPNGLWVLAKVIQAANSLDPAVVKAKWESLDKVDTLFGTGIVSGDETYGIKHHAVSHPVQYSKLVKGKVVYGGWIPATPVP